MRLRLKQIEQQVDFRCNDLTIFERWKGKDAFKVPRQGETVLFVSKGGDQILWIIGYDAKVMVGKVERRRIETIRFRLSGGKWNPLLLADDAERVGIELEGIKKFKEAFGDQQERKRGMHGKAA